MTTRANRWLLIAAASALTIGLGACNKPATATDTGNATADATAAPPAGAMNADNTAGTNAMAPSSNSTSGQ
ncbi:MAG TPA: hypothetical protein VGI30_13050 [Caulobacteraceae bacterium]